MTPLTELTALIREYAERHGITLGCYWQTYDGFRYALREKVTGNLIFYAKDETDFLNKIKE
jgi:hypothetical protein